MRRGWEKNIHTRVSISPYAPSSRNNSPTQVYEYITQVTSQTSKQTFVVHWGDGCSVWRHHKDLCAPSSRWEVGFLRYLRRSNMSDDGNVKWRRKGSEAGRMAVNVSPEPDPARHRMVFQARIRFCLFFFRTGTWISKYVPSSRPPLYLGQSGAKFCSLLYSCCFGDTLLVFLRLLSGGVGFGCLFRFCCVVGFSDCCQREMSSAQ